MSYPERLLPKRHFGYILPKSIIDGFLIRHTKSKVPENLDSQLRVKFVCEPREHILDLSCNLLGHFKLGDTKIEVNPEHKVRYYQKWFPLTSSLKPDIEEFSFIEDRGYYMIPISKAHSHQVPVKDKNADFMLTQLGSPVVRFHKFWGSGVVILAVCGVFRLSFDL
jgi:hypothetical protein